MSGVTFLTCLADWQNNSHAIDGENPTVKLREKQHNLMGRKRWGIENDILQEKEQGYQYTHIFSHNWNAMKGYHYLMHLAHLLNELAQNSIDLMEQVQEIGIRGFIRLLRDTISGPWLNKERIEILGKECHQLRLIA
ncbi:hypothetical protein L7E55_16655 [Pelotomaculum isophthalicicum JI]|uniref:Uncharacterized protein n=1 Tax=Pelotomaculum isophthalicicum JI TaxID=947010 RepID=A0A9X4JUW1_9FIRM|nr:hypothetical protein [Pelotomaculum isophthalicicum]MDF9409955.1 hypothetical protein [Pelotomaculum isophthalicicum JI]